MASDAGHNQGICAAGNRSQTSQSSLRCCGVTAASQAQPVSLSVPIVDFIFNPKGYTYIMPPVVGIEPFFSDQVLLTAHM